MNSARDITYLSTPVGVSMADQWFDIAALDHFWIRRRFDVFRQLSGGLVSQAREIAEVGCGHGLVQRQIEDAYGREVTGFDLNQFALQRSLSRLSKLYCYDIGQRNPEFHQRFDLIFLFDVLEHITDEDSFLTSLLFHLSPGGKLVINVPAGQWGYSSYDRVLGHIRRYSIRTLRATAERSHLEVAVWTYWAFPMLPALAIRKLWPLGNAGDDKIVSKGFDSRGGAMNRLFGLVSRCEVIPQKIVGASLMAVLHRDAG
jgi:SAM-dependent methyltransferase